MPLYEIMSQRREEVLACAKNLIRRQRPASPRVDAVRDASLPAFLDAVATEMRDRRGATVQAPRETRFKPAPKSECSDIGELVHLYGGLCYGTLEVAGRYGVYISVRDHQELNQSLDACIARTVMQWEREKLRAVLARALKAEPMSARPREAPTRAAGAPPPSPDSRAATQTR